MLLLAVTLAGTLIQPAAAPHTATISGQVLEDGTGAPIVGAQVVLMPSHPPKPPAPFSDEFRASATDRNGRYEIANVEAGRYRINVLKAGFAGPFGPELPEVTLKAGERREGVNVTLQRGAVITGRVLDETGEPLANAQVMLMRRPPVSPRAVGPRPDFLMPAGANAETNDMGEFRLFGLRPDEYFVVASVHSWFSGAPLAPHGRTILPTYFPGTTDSASAQPINVAAGQTAGDVVIRMIGAPAFQITGLVRDEAGRPVVNAMVKLNPDEPWKRPMFVGMPPQTRTDASGRFTLNNVTNGTYALLAIAPVVIVRQESSGTGGVSGTVSVSGGAGGHFTSLIGSGSVGGMVMTETRDGTTIQYRDDQGTRVAITVTDANVENLEIVVRPPAR